MRRKVQCFAKRKQQILLRTRSGGEFHCFWEATNRAIIQELVGPVDDYELPSAAVSAAAPIASDVAKVNVTYRGSSVDVNSAQVKASLDADANIAPANQATGGLLFNSILVNMLFLFKASSERRRQMICISLHHLINKRSLPTW